MYFESFYTQVTGEVVVILYKSSLYQRLGTPWWVMAWTDWAQTCYHQWLPPGDL